jgi:hypothetical protein
LDQLPVGGIEHCHALGILDEEDMLVGRKPDVHRPAAERQGLTGGADQLAGRYDNAVTFVRADVLLLERVGGSRGLLFV